MREIIRDGLFGDIVGITDGTITLRVVDRSEADSCIVRHHYSHKATKNGWLSLSVNGGLGYMQLGYGIRPRLKHTVCAAITPTNYREFDRMWLSDELPKFSESRAIGLLLRFLRAAHPHIKFLITYADESAGNRGTIYRATNAVEIAPVPVDFYVLADGERVHPVSMYHRHKTRAWSVLRDKYPGIKHVLGRRSGVMQRRFVYPLDRWAMKQLSGRESGVKVEVGK